MSAKYLLPCHNGNSVEVTTADAGRTVTCPCGKRVQVPTLRGVQSLPRAQQPEARPTAPTWSAQQGAMFTVGLCLLLAGLIGLGMLFGRWRQIETAKPDMDQELLAKVKQSVESADPASTLEGWYALRSNPLPADRNQLQWEYNRKVAGQFAIYMAIAGAVAAVGLLMAIGGPLMRPAPPQRRPVKMPQKA